MHSRSQRYGARRRRALLTAVLALAGSASAEEAEAPRRDEPGEGESDAAEPAPARPSSTVRPGEASGDTKKAGAAIAVEEPAAPEDKSSGLVVVPLILYAPETHLGLGGFGVHFFRLAGEAADSRVSSLALIALVTTRKQVILELLPEFYWGAEGNHVRSKLEYQIFPDSFWGIGDRTPDSAEERYSRSRLRFRSLLHRRIVGPFYAGLYVEAMWFHATYTDPDGTFATEDVPGEPGGVTNGIGPTVAFDTRDNAISARRGTLVNATFTLYDDVFGSAYDFRKFVLDARQFFSLGGEHALGIRFWGEAQGGDVPYYQLAMVGGDELLRGYFMGRYRDKNLGVLEAEYRFPIAWLFSGVAFAGVGEVASSVSELDLDPLRWSVGGGGRLALNRKERLNLRLDVGFGYGTYGFYLNASEAF